MVGIRQYVRGIRNEGIVYFLGNHSVHLLSFHRGLTVHEHGQKPVAEAGKLNIFKYAAFVPLPKSKYIWQEFFQVSYEIPNTVYYLHC